MSPYAHLSNVPAARHLLTELRRAGLPTSAGMSQADALIALDNARDAAAERQQEPPASLDEIADLLRRYSTGQQCNTTQSTRPGTTPRSLHMPAGGPSGGRS